MAYYQLVNLWSGNLVGEYDTEEQALADVQAALAQAGPDRLAGVGLCRVEDDGSGKIVAEGTELASRHPAAA